MNVGRIDAISIQQINWQLLTARQIIDYKNQGQQVPDKYLVWAQDFIKSIDSDDNTTYEAAQSIEYNKSKETSLDNDITTTNEDNTDNSEDVKEPQDIENTDPESIGENINETVPVETLNNAQSKRKEKEDDGESLREIALSFISYSKSNTVKSIMSKFHMDKIKSNSSDEITELDSNMQTILNKISQNQNLIKKGIKDINDGNGSFDKVMQYQSELEKLGIKGQNEVSNSEAMFNKYGADLDNQIPIQTDAMDFGNETVYIGKSLIKKAQKHNLIFMIIDKIIGLLAISSGKLSQFASNKGSSVQSISAAVNSANLSNASNYHSQISSKTGIEYSVNHQENNTKNNENDKNSNNNKDVNSENINNASLDEILKRKIRKGQAIE